MKLAVLVATGLLMASVLAVLILLTYREPRQTTGYLATGLCAYVLAKVFERADRSIVAVGHVVSGHTLTPLGAAAGITCTAAMLNVRRR
jgi:hypothetical protein